MSPFWITLIFGTHFVHCLLLATNLSHMPQNQGAFSKLNFQLIGQLEANNCVDSAQNKYCPKS